MKRMRGLSLFAILIVGLFPMQASVQASSMRFPTSPAAGDLDWDTYFAIPGVANVYNGVGSYPYGGYGSGVYAVLPAQDGSMYVGGSFTLASGRPVQNIARWDGVRWSAVGGGLPCSVRALAFHPLNGTLYAGCAGVYENDVNTGRIYRLTNGAWESIASFISLSYHQEVSPDVLALAFDPSGNLYAGGSFALLNGSTFVGGIARMDTSGNWQMLGKGLANGAVTDLVVDGVGNVVASGTFTRVKNTHPDYPNGIDVFGTYGVAYWNQAEWQALDYGPANGLANSHVTLLDGKLYLLGWNGVWLWNGEIWLNQNFPATGEIHRPGEMITAPDGSLLVADQILENGVTYLALMRYQAGTWTEIGRGPDSSITEVHALAQLPNGTIFMGGELDQFAGLTIDNIVMYAGGAWQGLGAGQARHLGISWANYMDFGPDGSMYLGTPNQIYHWDGETLTEMGPEIPTPYNVHGINDMVVDQAGTVYIGGDFVQIDGVVVNHLAQWDGTKWQPVVGGTDGEVLDLELDPLNYLYVAGRFKYVAGDLRVTGVARYKDGWWNALNGDPRCPASPSTSDFCPVYQVAWDQVDFKLYFAGSIYRDGEYRGTWEWDPFDGFQYLTPPPANCIEPMVVDKTGRLLISCSGGGGPAGVYLWDDWKWTRISFEYSPGAAGGVDQLVRDKNGDVYAGGNFSLVNGQTINNIARFDGSAWYPLGSGLNIAPRTMNFDEQGRLWVLSHELRGAGSRRVKDWARFTPVASAPAALNLNYTTGRPGSVIRITGEHFIPGGEASVWVDGQQVAVGIPVDEEGNLLFRLDTTQGGEGMHQITVSQNPSATVMLRLSNELPLRTSAEGGNLVVMPNLPGLKMIYLPAVRR